VSERRNARAALAEIVAAGEDGRLDEICDQFGVLVMSAFGSAARESLAEPNDLDIGVGFRREPHRKNGTGDRIALWTALVELSDYEGIDLIVLDVDDPVLRAEALTGVPIYESERCAYAEAQIAAVGERRDTAHMRRRNLELMAR
jgi:predicted nucleotidyltransferase